MHFAVLQKYPLKNEICPDGTTQCPTGDTCCPRNDSYVCCPQPEAVCCEDEQHCCPKDYSCDKENKTCRKNGQVLAYFNEQCPLPGDNLCPDGNHMCPSGSTCCEMSYSQWGCCPLVNAVCCMDGERCCPAGTTCDLTEKTCVSRNSILPAVKKQSLSRINDLGSYVKDTLLCPDSNSVCTHTQTCCQVSSGRYGCCPESLSCGPDEEICESRSKMMNLLGATLI